MYTVNPELWKSIFAIPTEIIDKHLKLAGALQIKALLWILRHSSESFDENDISKATGYSADDVKDALQYWIENGIINKDGYLKKVEEKVAEEKPKNKKQLMYSFESKPTNEQIAARTEESEEIKFLFNEAQTKLGRTIGYDAMSNLLMLYDHYGLPIEVILMLLEFCKSINKTSIAYITKVGRDWAEKEIDTMEKADEQIEAIKSKNTLWKDLCAMTGISNPIPTQSQAKYLETWTNVWGMSLEMISLAYEEMANHTTKLSFPYMNKVLQNWHENSITTPEAVEAEKQKRAVDSKPEPSYDLDAFTAQALKKPLKYKKD